MPIKDYLRIGGLVIAMTLALALRPVSPDGAAPAGWAQGFEAITPAQVEITTLPHLPPRPA